MKNDSCISTPAQLKPMLFKGQLYYSNIREGHWVPVLWNCLEEISQLGGLSFGAHSGHHQSPQCLPLYLPTFSAAATPLPCFTLGRKWALRSRANKKQSFQPPSACLMLFEPLFFFQWAPNTFYNSLMPGPEVRPERKDSFQWDLGLILLHKGVFCMSPAGVGIWCGSWPAGSCVVAAIDKYTQTTEILWRKRDCVAAF